MNNVQLEGRLTTDPDIRYTEAGYCIGKFTLAVKRFYDVKKPDAQEADFIPCVAFGKTAEDIGNNVAKGQRLLIHRGTLATSKYKDKEGNNRNYMAVHVFGFSYIEKKS